MGTGILAGLAMSLAAGSRLQAQAAPSAWDRAFAQEDAPFDSLVAWLRQGPSYRSDVPIGTLRRERVDGQGIRHPYLVVVPPEYRPDRAWPVRVYLHGTIDREAWLGDEFFDPQVRTTPGPWADLSPWTGSDFIAVFPAGWRGSPWWSLRQVINLQEILNRLKAEYHIDENRVHLLGYSDGGSGVWFHASRAPTPWASFNAWIASPAVVGTEATGSDGEFHLAAVRGRPVYAVNTEEDPRYPADKVVPILDVLRSRGVPVSIHRRTGGHDLTWLPAEWASITAFLDSTVRNPLPDYLTWQTTFTNRYVRNAWVLITELGAVDGETLFPNDQLFPRLRLSGRLEVIRRGNSVTVNTAGVRRFRLLLSPDQFDFQQPVHVVVNGVQVFRKRVERNGEVLRRWAAVDRDRTMLFAAELEILVPGAPPPKNP